MPTEFPQDFQLEAPEICQPIADRMEALASVLQTEAVGFRSRSNHSINFLSLAQKVHSARRSVDDVFGLAGFAVSPAWDIMLDLYQARMLRKRISVTSACIGGACPTTTGLRWLQLLEDMGLVLREPDDHDRRRHVVALTEEGSKKTERGLRAYQS